MNRIDPTLERHAREDAHVRTKLLATVCLLAGLGIGAVWYYRTPNRGAVSEEGPAVSQEVVTLSAETKAVQQKLDSPKTSSPAKATVANSQIDSEALAEVKRQVPNYASVSVEEGTRILRESALKDFKAKVSEMAIQMKEAEQRFSQTQNENSKEEHQTVKKHLKQVQADHAENLKQIEARSVALIEAFRQLKEAAR